tara:strand:- start:3396 stop:4004 length:609 start_codon:yes stop_codon:yes gene_type:complete
MSGVFPITAGFETLDWQSNTNSRVSVSVSGKTQRIKTGAQFWSFKLKSPAMTRAEVMADFAFIVKQDGQVESFTIVPPTVSSARGTASSTISVVADSSVSPAYNNQKGSSVVPVSGGSGTLLKGDLVKFASHDKVYMLTEDSNMDGSTVDTLSIYPPLVADATGNVTYDNVPIKVYFDKDQQKYITQADGTFKYEIVMNEEI